VKLSYEGKIDGKLVREVAPNAHLYGSQKATWEEAGAEGNHYGIPEIVAGVVGKKTGDKAEFSHAFADDFAEEALRGKTAVYEVEILEVRGKIMPELDEEFFKSAGVKDADEFKQRVTTALQEHHESAAAEQRREKALKLLLEAADFSVPQLAIDAAAEELFFAYAERRLRAGTEWAEIEAEKKAFLDDARERAVEQVKTRFLLAKIAKTEELKLDREALANRLSYEAYARREDPKKFVNEVLKDRERLARFQGETIAAQALSLVVEAAKG